MVLWGGPWGYPDGALKKPFDALEPPWVGLRTGLGVQGWLEMFRERLSEGIYASSFLLDSVSLSG